MTAKAADRAYRSLDPHKVIETIATLHRRITERFQDSGIARVCAELLVIARENSVRARHIGRGNVALRVAIYVVLGLGVLALTWIGFEVIPFRTSGADAFSAIQGLEAAANLVVLIAAAAFFLTQIEERMRRRQALAALHEMRSIIHVIDMHQLTKDPSAMTVSATASSPRRFLDRVETSRYLDYCSEMLSLSAKVAVLFAQGFPDPAVIDNVSEIERLAAGLSQKIWQKIMIIQAEGGR